MGPTILYTDQGELGSQISAQLVEIAFPLAPPNRKEHIQVTRENETVGSSRQGRPFSWGFVGLGRPTEDL